MKETKYAGTQTEKNLMAAFAGESEARNKYTYFASKAKKEGYEQIAALFLKTADNEKKHAKLWFKELNGIGDTAENLLSAAKGENYEWAGCAGIQLRQFDPQFLLCVSAGLSVLRHHRQQYPLWQARRLHGGGAGRCKEGAVLRLYHGAAGGL